ncbi:hypothetical protein NC653_000899 [Populus alba x Populus x berolinensis]|uniref:Reverse transcriptase Ty1/copia-type domain-containing protein n=1 Tax=Populus alba x Populus x berolinensis TaxID=444605 RepID=A0AAD6WFW3_9ROSI|nr:hypothetical protein NC653_000899 [Populus alba x Populus x berolinensis]
MKKPRVDHLRIFGSVAYAKIQEERRTKLEDKSQKCILLGYGENLHCYKLYNPMTKKMIMSRDVKFDEEQEWNWNFEDQPQKLIIDEEQIQKDEGEIINDPITFEEAYQEDRWKKTMKEKNSIIKHNIWELITLPKGHNAIGVKWIFKTKRNVEGEIEKHKARLVAKKYKQQYRVDYEDVFALVARMETLRLMISLEMKDISDGCKVSFLERLKKALYGLKQAQRAWNSRIDGYLSLKVFTRCLYEHALYVKKSLQGRVMFVCLYVDDILFTGDDPTMIQDFKQSMVKEFEMTDLGFMAYFMGLESNNSMPIVTHPWFIPNSLSPKTKTLRLTTHGFLSSTAPGDLIHGSDLIFSSRPNVFSSDFRVHSSTLHQQLSASLSLFPSSTASSLVFPLHQ